MNPYRKPDQYYIDSYDRYTIEKLKELEKQEKKPLKFPARKTEHSIIESQYDPTTIFYNTAVSRAQSREDFIAKWKGCDEQKDSSVRQSEIPKDVRCNKCNLEMYFEGYMFKEDDTQILFVFDCSKKHFPKKIIYPNRREYIFPIRRCDKCGGTENKSVTKETKKRLIIIDTCLHCGDVHKLDLDLTPEKIIPIDENDRKKYCLDFIGRSTFMQDLIKIGEFYEQMEEWKKEKILNEENWVDKIEKVKVINLEERLSKISEELGFKKFKFETPKTTPFFLVEFSAQDPSDRNESESVRLLTKNIKKHLLPTNWRLMTDGIYYRLGFLSGRLRAYEDAESLLKIGKEIKEKLQNEANRDTV